ncbi:MAG TPA: hypothetical protein VI895_14105 [Bdellovibrionota bacterium]|nr:hypothetical protein [Bdellovibrionota bacterium]
MNPALFANYNANLAQRQPTSPSGSVRRNDILQNGNQALGGGVCFNTAAGTYINCTTGGAIQAGTSQAVLLCQLRGLLCPEKAAQTTKPDAGKKGKGIGDTDQGFVSGGSRVDSDLYANQTDRWKRACGSANIPGFRQNRLAQLKIVDAAAKDPTNEDLKKKAASATDELAKLEAQLQEEISKLEQSTQPDADADGIPDACEDTLRAANFSLAENEVPNGYLVTIKKIKAETLRDRILNDPDLKAQMAKARLHKWDIRDRDQLNNALAVLIAFDRATNGESSEAVVRKILDWADSADPVKLDKDRYETVIAETALPADLKSKKDVSVLKGGSHPSQALFRDPRIPVADFSYADINPIYTDFQNLADDEYMVYVAEAKIAAPNFTIGLRKKNGGRDAGLAIAFVDGQIAAHSLDLQKIDGTVKDRLGDIAKRREKAFEKLPNSKSRRLLTMIALQDVTREQEKVDIRDYFAVKFDSMNETYWELLPQEMASFKELKSDNSVILGWKPPVSAVAATVGGNAGEGAAIGLPSCDELKTNIETKRAELADASEPEAASINDQINKLQALIDGNKCR